MRLIDADAFSEKYGNYYAEEGPEWGFIGKIGQLISEQPTIDAAPVRRGHWEKSFSGDENIKYCSECGGSVVRSVFMPHTFDYCPYCGAYMKEGGAE